MSALKKLLSIICICVLCVTAQAQVVIGVTRTGQTGTAGENLPFVNQFGQIVAYPTLSPTGELLDVMRPSVVTNTTVTNITKISATAGGKIVFQGASEVTECGICYGTSEYPTILDSHISATDISDGEFTVNLTGLQQNTTYYVRAYATNAMGTSYGTSWSFTTRGDANIIIAGKTANVTYTGSEQSVTGYTVTIPDGINITEDQISGPTITAAGTNVGTYTTSISSNAFSCSNSNYDVTFTVTSGASLTINKAAATVAITGNNATKTYNGSEQSVTGYNIVIPDNVTLTADDITYTGTTTPTAKGTNAGTYAMGLTAANFSNGNGNYDVTFEVTDGSLTISKAEATVTVDANQTKVYGETDPTLTATVTGVAGDETLNYTLSRAEGENAGEYAITVTLGENPNYNVTVTNGTFTITKATATVAAVNKSKVYGTSDPELNATVEGAETLNYTLSRAEGENVGEYAIMVTLGENPNYNVTVTNGTFTITKATATVAAVNKSKVYGETDPTLTATVEGAETLNYTLSRAEGENVGEYAITVTLGENPNYNVSATNGTFTITKATATVAADAKSKVYGTSDPELTATVEGAETLNYTLSRAEGENVGEYAIMVTLGENPNYNVTATNGTFTITKATATVTITGATDTKTYNGSAQSVTGYTVSIPSGVSITESQISCSATATATGTNADTYAMGLTPDAFSCSNTNYEVTFTVTDGSLTITPAAAVVKANNATKVAGESDPTFTVTVTGLKGSDQASVLEYTISRETGEAVGSYTITPTGAAEQGNYTVTYQTGALTITEPACPTLGTTTYTPNPVVASSTNIVLTTPVNDMVEAAVTLNNLIYTISGEGITTTTISATYNNGSMTATITDLTSYRGKAITVTPSVTTAGCTNPSTLTGDAVVICVPYATTLTNGTTTGAGVSNKKVLFQNEGITITANITNNVSSQIDSYGFLLANNSSDIQSYSSEHAVSGGTISDNSYSYKIGFDSCGRTIYYRAYIIMNGCQDPILSPVTNVVMWGPEDFAITANPSTAVSSGTSVTLTANANMTVGSWTGTKVSLALTACGPNPSVPEGTTVAPLETWIGMFESMQSCWLWGYMEEQILSGLGISSLGDVDFYYEWDNGATTKTRTVQPNSSTTYTCDGVFTYKNVTCRTSTTKTVTVQ
ncbi:MAG: hypothetical protein K6A41_01455 [Bacteroidales bacterium]|nr:hypothetical protein [Bacteroidales bacterium]